MPVETEIKLQFMAASNARAIRQGIGHGVRQALAAELPRALTRRMRSIYFDTPDHALAARRMSLRLRNNHAQWLQTVKTPAKPRPGLQTYAEFELAVPGERLDLSLLAPGVPGRKWLLSVKDDLRPIFETDLERTTWLVIAGESEIELAWDRGHIRAGTRAEPVNELELELKKGGQRFLFSLARALAETLPVRPGHATKAERGMRLAKGEVPTAQSGSAASLSSRDSAEAAFRKIAGQCLLQMRANEHALLGTGAPEAIHQFRVALRRLRAAVNIYRDLIDEEVYRRWQDDQKWLHQAFGRVRDLDVFCARTLKRLMDSYRNEAGLTRLGAAAAEARKAALAAATGAVNSRRYAVMLIDLPQMLDTGAWRRPVAAAAPEMPAVEFAVKQLQKRYKRVRKLGDRWPDLEIADLHRLRILVKKLRYAALAFASLFPVKSARGFLAALEVLQDCLGLLNDNAVGQQLANELAAAAEGGCIASPEMERALSIASGWHSRGIEDSYENFDACWRSFQECKRFWKG